MNGETRLFLGGISGAVLVFFAFSAGATFGLVCVFGLAVAGVVVAIPRPNPSERPAENTEPAKPPEEIQEEVLRLITEKVAFLENVEREHGPAAREKVEELVQQHDFLKTEGGV